jgi:hypothetical protein
MKEKILFIRRSAAFGGIEVLLMDWISSIDFGKNAVTVASTMDCYSDKIADKGVPVSCKTCSLPVMGNPWNIYRSWSRDIRKVSPNKVVFLEGRVDEIPLSAVLAGYAAARGNVYMTEHLAWPDPPERTRSTHFGFLPGGDCGTADVGGADPELPVAADPRRQRSGEEHAPVIRVPEREDLHRVSRGGCGEVRSIPREENPLAPRTRHSGRRLRHRQHREVGEGEAAGTTDPRLRGIIAGSAGPVAADGRGWALEEGTRRFRRFHRRRGPDPVPRPGG